MSKFLLTANRRDGHFHRLVIVGAITILSLRSRSSPTSLRGDSSPGHLRRRGRPNAGAAVATPIEQQMSGVDNMNYMYSLNATATRTRP